MSHTEQTIKAVIAADPVMEPLVSRLDFPAPVPDRDPYFDLVETIVYQQLSIKAAATIFGRFLALFPDQQPHPELLVGMETKQLRQVGLSGQKSGYVKNIAAFFLQENLLDYHWTSWDDEEIIRLLTRIKGVGRWTAEMILMFTLNRPDVFPVDDLGIQTAMSRLYGISKEEKDWKIKMQEAVSAWKPYRTYGSKYLWKFLDTGR
ncbi:MAG: DNA-3-methyladenine glycosylase 2 family protein [Saprospiraceae bacterium]